MSALVSARSGAAALTLLSLGACQQIPYYNESLGWFSRSPYDPEARAIERAIPPPAPGGPAGAPAAGAEKAALNADYRRTADGGYVLANPPPGMTVTLGSKRLLNVAEAESATGGASNSAALEPAPDVPPLGFSRQRRVIYGSNRGPFSIATMRTLR
jgi:hypothetical protein